MPGFLAAALVAALASQSIPQPQGATDARQADTKPSRQVRLTGCISRDRLAPGQFTFLDNDAGAKYRLTGKGLKNFIGRQVEIVGGPPGKRITFRTGLYPSPNVAAQAGALDPAVAAVANLPGGAADVAASMPLPELRASRIRVVEGACQ